ACPSLSGRASSGEDLPRRGYSAVKEARASPLRPGSSWDGCCRHLSCVRRRDISATHSGGFDVLMELDGPITPPSPPLANTAHDPGLIWPATRPFRSPLPGCSFATIAPGERMGGEYNGS